MKAKRKRRTHGRARAAARLARSAAAVRAAAPLGLRLRAARSVLLLVDVHERLAPAIEDAERVIAHCAVLLQAAALLRVPVALTEHCPERLGPTLGALRARVAAEAIVRKVHFCAADEPALAQRIAAINRPQIVLAGMEAHVCVLQSALGFAERGYRPYVVADACGSRRAHSHALALERLRAAQIPVVTTEMVLFEWLDHAEHPQLRALLALIK